MISIRFYRRGGAPVPAPALRGQPGVGLPLQVYLARSPTRLTIVPLLNRFYRRGGAPVPALALRGQPGVGLPLQVYLARSPTRLTI
ncbi:hypothetical protein, partial [Microcoleus sp. D2_18a_B4]|uniref:hypothetical protein n=1 Tax=Microcoleus sp. D2_18a_B4 TaxID=3055329 RepID=UPI002FD0D693